MATDQNNTAEPGDSKKKLIINYLPQNFTDQELHAMFTNVGPIESSRIMKDYKTGYSYGYGFVSFVKEEDAERAIGTFNGFNIQNKRMKVSYARPPGEEIKDTNLYVSNLPKEINEEQLELLFSPFGDIVQKNILKDKITGMPRGVAFVRYAKKESAQAAISALQNTQLDGAMQPLQVKLAEEHGKQKALYYAGLQSGMSLKRMNNPASFNNRGRGGGGNVRFNPIGYQNGFMH